MKTRKKITLPHFRRQHPGIEVRDLGKPGRDHIVRAIEGSALIAEGIGRNFEEALLNLSNRIYRVMSLRQFEAQGYEDANTGRIEPLSAHHKKKRSKGRDDSQGNLAGVGMRTHAAQHEGKRR